MFTDLPDGAIIVLTRGGDQEIWKIVTGKIRPRFADFDLATGVQGITGVGRPLVAGDTVYRCVGGNPHLKIRRTYVLKAGDCEWVDTGLVSTFPGPNQGQKVFTNRLRRRI